MFSHGFCFGDCILSSKARRMSGILKGLLQNRRQSLPGLSCGSFMGSTWMKIYQKGIFRNSPAFFHRMDVEWYEQFPALMHTIIECTISVYFQMIFGIFRYVFIRRLLWGGRWSSPPGKILVFNCQGRGLPVDMIYIYIFIVPHAPCSKEFLRIPQITSKDTP